MKLKIFFANFQILGPLGCQGWVVIPQNVKKRSKSLHPIFTQERGEGVGELTREKVRGATVHKVENTNMTDCISSL
jgi:hypothetical protein